MSRISVTEETLDAAIEGNAAAVTTVVRALQGPFYALARRLLLDAADAEDATQEALLRAVTHLSQYDGRAQFSTWAWRIAVNQCLDYKKKRYRHALLTKEAFAADLTAGLAQSAAESPEDAYQLEQVKVGCGMAMLSVLDGDHRAAYVLGEILELSSDEAADVLDIGPATFRKRLSRARRKVTAILKEHCGIFDSSNACRCHKRLDRARALGRVKPGSAASRLDLPALRQRLQAIPSLQRAVAFYRADPEFTSKRDFVERVRTVLRRSPLS